MISEIEHALLLDRINTLEKQVALSSALIAAERTHFRDDNSKVTSHILTLLEGKVLPLLDNSLNGLLKDKPKVQYAKGKLSLIIEDIEDSIKWLSNN